MPPQFSLIAQDGHGPARLRDATQIDTSHTPHAAQKKLRWQMMKRHLLLFHLLHLLAVCFTVCLCIHPGDLAEPKNEPQMHPGAMK